MILSYVYLDNYIEKEISLLILGVIGAFFLMLAIKGRNKADKSEKYKTRIKELFEVLLFAKVGKCE